ncbi:DNA polymerase-4 [Mycetocola sp. CAN_C7]|uniref:DNA polymerase IV n=1 Tax=Mycetocola sp. CAN_C7 TaxID=2787724 RepID=UPI0018CB6EBA
MSRQDGSARQVTTDLTNDEGAHILHIDMDAFFASVELLDHPELRGKPVIIGHAEGRSVVTSATYEARRFGVGAAMPVSKALRLCPQAIVLPPHHERYTDYSRRVMAIFRDATPLVEPLSIDEAFLDVSGARRLLGTPATVGALIRERVERETGLTCSVGAAATKFVAKVASGRAKPDGLLVVPPAQTLEFLHPLSIRALWGVGAKTEEALLRIGLHTVGDVAATPLTTLRKAVGNATGVKLHELAQGRDTRSVVTSTAEKSIGHEVTFHEDITDPTRLRLELLRLADQVAVRLRKAGLSARTVAIKIRFDDFTTLTRSHTLAEPSNVGRRLYEEANDLFTALGIEGRPVRLVGVRAEQLLDGDGVMASLWDPDEEWRDAETTIDSLRARFGGTAVRRASMLGRGRGETAGGTRAPRD